MLLLDDSAHIASELNYTINSSPLHCDFWMISRHFPTAVKFPDTTQFSRKVVTLIIAETEYRVYNATTKCIKAEYIMPSVKMCKYSSN